MTKEQRDNRKQERAKHKEKFGEARIGVPALFFVGMDEGDVDRFTISIYKSALNDPVWNDCRFFPGSWQSVSVDLTLEQLTDFIAKMTIRLNEMISAVNKKVEIIRAVDVIEKAAK